MIEAHRTILHVDMDAFFASIEQRDNPSYRGKPVIVGARPGHRGVVSAASYEARRYGIHSAMPINEAHGRCPQGAFVRPRMELYARESQEIMAVLTAFSPAVEQVSIDEAFIDITGTSRLWGTPAKTAEALAARIRNERRLTASIGIAPNKFIAKIASDLNKPNGITLAPFGQADIEQWLAPMPVGRIWGVGRITAALLDSMGVRTIGELQQCPCEFLIRRFGAAGRSLWELARGIDDRPVGEEGPAQSISREHTFDRDCRDREEFRRVLLSLSRDVGRQARQQGLAAATVFLTFRLPDFSRHTRRTTIARPTALSRRIFEEAVRMLDETRIPSGGLRLIGVGVTNFGRSEQLDLFAGENDDPALEASESAMDRINRRFGEKALFLGGEVKGAEASNKRARGK
jgi:DNA polymerase-4